MYYIFTTFWCIYVTDLVLNKFHIRVFDENNDLHILYICLILSLKYKISGSL